MVISKKNEKKNSVKLVNKVFFAALKLSLIHISEPTRH